jgi:hypothetical protein
MGGTEDVTLKEYASELTYAKTPYEIKGYPPELKILFRESIYKDGSLRVNQKLFMVMITGAFLGALSGFLIDLFVRAIQYRTASRFKHWHAQFILFQLGVNSLFMALLTASSVNFLPWMELSVAGVFFRILFFLVQGNLSKNVSHFLPHGFRPRYDNDEDITDAEAK